MTVTPRKPSIRCVNPRLNRERKKREREAYSESEKRSADMERCRSADVGVMI